ncbi:MBL fold metallo-hydrolase [Amycolatopsis sp. 195334CR]|uniref:MBL fold metallo-hydrolase n=1 Tax=Amycolatopsis sp. 195334CR TaxID=2814588 RepID=UPI001A8F84EA|nr:MBL fold metallo-hydrolase [Amycolatopsis sp. 195334CR]MBN6040879.1 MBL fold metallo-hydrolase [Amycolatopsis sp. 195334CR]
MLVVGFPSGAFAANCYLVARDAGTECVIIDPGQEAAPKVAAALDEHRLTPVAVLATHGHFDHVADAAAFGLPVHLRPEDRGLLTDPASGASPQLLAALGDAVRPVEPVELVDLTDGDLEIAGLTITVAHTPGHTPGSAIFRLGELAFTGDTLFAGSIGRTDLPGGSVSQLEQSLADRLLTLDDRTVVLPGHGGTSTIGRERQANPFLTALKVTHG